MKLTVHGKSGSLNQFVRKFTNPKGNVVEYPKIRGARNIDNPRHWAWNLTWKDKIDGKFVSRSINIPPDLVAEVKAMILENVDIHKIHAFLRP